MVARPPPGGAPRHLLGIGDVDDIVHAVAAGIDSFDCATPTRLARHGTALVHDPAGALAARPRQGGPPRVAGADRPGCPCPACREHTRGYLHYLIRAGELTAKRLVTLHNLTFMERLMRGLREAILAGELDAHAGPCWPARRARREPADGLPYWLDEPYAARRPSPATWRWRRA